MSFNNRLATDKQTATTRKINLAWFSYHFTHFCGGPYNNADHRMWANRGVCLPRMGNGRVTILWPRMIAMNGPCVSTYGLCRWLLIKGRDGIIQDDGAWAFILNQTEWMTPSFYLAWQCYSFTNTKHLPLGVNLRAAVHVRVLYHTSRSSLGDLATAAERHAGGEIRDR